MVTLCLRYLFKAERWGSSLGTNLSSFFFFFCKPVWTKLLLKPQMYKSRGKVKRLASWMLVHVLKQFRVTCRMLPTFNFIPLLHLRGLYLLLLHTKRAFLFWRRFCIQLGSVFQKMSGRKPDFWYYDILQVLFWSCSSNCTVLSKGRSPSYLDTTRYEVLNKAICCLYK